MLDTVGSWSEETEFSLSHSERSIKLAKQDVGV